MSYDPWFAESGFGHGSGSGSGYGYGGRSTRVPSIRAAGQQPARSRFETTPVFLADLAVDSSGEATVKAKLPDNLSTFRITAIASARLVDGTSPGRFGKNDARTVVTAPLVLRAAMPRALRPGDRAELAAIVQNNTGVAGRLSVTARVVEEPGSKGHVLKLLSPATASAEVTPGDQTRLTFQIEATAPGSPDFELQAALTPTAGGAKITDGLRLPLPVQPERTLTERVAAYGAVTNDQAVAIPIKLPTDVLRGHGGVTVSTTSSLLGGLEDAVHALVQYPYGCVEQTASRLLPIVALGALEDYPLGVDDPKDFLKIGVERILAMQTDDGGFGYWPGSKEAHVYASAYATWILDLAKKAGHPVPQAALDRALKFLETRVNGLVLTQLPVDWGYHDGVRVAIALHVLADAGRDIHEQAAGLYTLRQQLPLFARAFLLMAIHRFDPHSLEVRTLQSELLGNIAELQATAHTSEAGRYGLDEFFASDGRSDAITLMALLRVQPDHPVVVKLARGLLERRIGGAWRNTQENAYALVALADYARVYEAELPDFTARAWVGRTNVLDAQFKGRELATRTSFTDMATILDLPREPGAALLPVVLQRQGQGRLYYRLAAEWAPSQVDLPARNQGFVVTRALRTSAGPATTSVPAGQPIAMDIKISSKIRVRYVVLDVPLPAGLEGVSRTLGVGRSAAVLGGRRGWWVSHEEQRADRVVVFADDLP
ncbi:MAG TPA: alpha-2-macroglobulin family protein, partial [Nannocystis sp.]